MDKGLDFPKARVWRLEDNSGDWVVAVPWSTWIVASWEDAMTRVGEEMEVYRLKLDLMDKNANGEVTSYSTAAEVIHGME